MTDEPPKKRGRKKAFLRDDGRAGAPQITIRLSPPILERVRSHPDGSRAYVERLVTEDIQRSGEEAGHQVEKSAPDDVTGQFLLTEPGGNVAAGKKPRKTKAMVQGQEATK